MMNSARLLARLRAHHAALRVLEAALAADVTALCADDPIEVDRALEAATFETHGRIVQALDAIELAHPNVVPALTTRNDRSTEAVTTRTTEEVVAELTEKETEK